MLTSLSQMCMFFQFLNSLFQFIDLLLDFGYALLSHVLHLPIRQNSQTNLRLSEKDNKAIANLLFFLMQWGLDLASLVDRFIGVNISFN